MISYLYFSYKVFRGRNCQRLVGFSLVTRVTLYFFGYSCFFDIQRDLNSCIKGLEEVYAG